MIAHLLGHDTPDPEVGSLLADADGYRSPLSPRLAVALAAGVRLVHLKERLVGSLRPAVGRVERASVPTGAGRRMSAATLSGLATEVRQAQKG